MNLLDKSAQNKITPDAILTYSVAATERIKQIGAEAVTNATVGVFQDENGVLKTNDAVEEALRAVPFTLGANYAPTEGVHGFIDAVIDNVLRSHRPAGTFIGGIATPGGTGALHNVFMNYTGPGDTAITTDSCWGNYKKMLHEIGREFATFNTFKADGGFDTDACLALCRQVAAGQTNVPLILNSPAHNPTGFAVSDAEWDVLIAGLTDIAENGRNNVILIADTAYIDYAGDAGRCFFEKFTGLPENFLVAVCASASKGFTLYGYRLGVTFCIAQSEAVCEQFVGAAKSSARGTWSSCNHVPMEAVAAIVGDADKLAALRRQQDEFSAIMAERAALFSTEAAACGLRIFPYVSGFFIYVPAPDHETAVAVYEVLTKDNIYVVPLGSGLRVAICAIGLNKVAGLAGKIKAACDTVMN